MVPPRGDDHIERFVLELMRTGCMLIGLVSELIGGPPTDAYPGGEVAAVVIEMCGSIRTAPAPADLVDLRRATELIDLTAARTLEHLQLACDLSRRSQGDDERGRTYG
jgi:hypothetical protein